MELSGKMNKMIHILHLSDIHLGTKSEANKYRVQLEADLSRELNIRQLDYLVISGDIANHSTQEEYDAAFELTDGIMKRFGLDSERVIIVPGNHDLNWKLSEDAYSFVPNSRQSNLEIPEGKYIPAGDVGVLVREEEGYKRRFANFSEHFYKKVYGEEYPINYAEQGILYQSSKNRILFLGLNSCWEIDHHEPHHGRASINMDALVHAFDQLQDSKYNDWLKIAVWHHPVTGPETMKNVDFLQQLAVNGFQICMHGHIHETQKRFYTYDPGREIHIIGAGTFGAPANEQVAGIPLQYNLLTFDLESIITVETRKKEKPDGAWSADARWGDKRNPKPRYDIKIHNVVNQTDMNEPINEPKNLQDLIYIICVKSDIQKAKKLYDDLKANGFNPWMENEDLKAGSNIKSMIRKHIKISKYVLVLISKNASTSKGLAQRELKIALDEFEEYPPDDIFLIPVKLEDCDIYHPQLDDLKAVNLYESYSDGFNRILKVLNPKKKL